jgi:hypothetical protein
MLVDVDFILDPSVCVVSDIGGIAGFACFGNLFHRLLLPYIHVATTTAATSRPKRPCCAPSRQCIRRVRQLLQREPREISSVIFGRELILFNAMVHCAKMRMDMSEGVVEYAASATSNFPEWLCAIVPQEIKRPDPYWGGGMGGDRSIATQYRSHF